MLLCQLPRFPLCQGLTRCTDRLCTDCSTALLQLHGKTVHGTAASVVLGKHHLRIALAVSAQCLQGPTDLAKMVRLPIVYAGRFIPVFFCVQVSVLGRCCVLPMDSCKRHSISREHNNIQDVLEISFTTLPLMCIPATDDVRTTRLTVSLALAAAWSTFRVPSTAGSINSF